MTNEVPPMISIENAREVSGAMLGVFNNYAGGLAVRWRFEHGASVLLTFASEQAFELRERLEASLDHLKKYGNPIEPAPAEQLPAEDFENARVGVRGWFMQTASDGIVWRIEASDASIYTFILRPPLIASIHDALAFAIKHLMLIDLRPFRNMKWTDMTDELEKLPGYALRSRIIAFEFSVEVFRRNALALTNHLRKACGVLSDELVRWDRRFEIDTFLLDSIYHLFNFVNAAMALVEHTRGFYNRYYKARGKVADYQEQIDRRFTGNGLVRFIQEMRNLMAHVGLVGLVHEKRFQGATVVGRVVMKRDAALVWDGWTSVARQWLREGPPDIDMLDVVSRYVGLVEEFHNWFMKARERDDWRDFQHAELLRRAILAKRGCDDIPSLKTLLTLPRNAFARMRDAIGSFLTAEQQFNLRSVENDGATWLRQALELVRESYFVDETLCAELVGHFSGSNDLDQS